MVFSPRFVPSDIKLVTFDIWNLWRLALLTLIAFDIFHFWHFFTLIYLFFPFFQLCARQTDNGMSNLWLDPESNITRVLSIIRYLGNQIMSYDFYSFKKLVGKLRFPRHWNSSKYTIQKRNVKYIVFFEHRTILWSSENINR